MSAISRQELFPISNVRDLDGAGGRLVQLSIRLNDIRTALYHGKANGMTGSKHVFSIRTSPSSPNHITEYRIDSSSLTPCSILGSKGLSFIGKWGSENEFQPLDNLPGPYQCLYVARDEQLKEVGL